MTSHRSMTDMLSDKRAAHQENLLVAMSNSEASFEHVRQMAVRLADPRHTSITLMHYLMPVYWQDNGRLSDEGELQEILRQEERALHAEGGSDSRHRNYLRYARAILTKAGVSPERIHVCMTRDGAECANSVLADVESGAFTNIVVFDHDRAVLEQVLGSSLGDFLEMHRRHADL